MRPRELLEVGDPLKGVWTEPNQDGFQAGGRIGYDNIVSITTDRLAGPMGFYVVAVIVRDNEKPDEIIPLHMAQTIEVECVEQLGK